MKYNTINTGLFLSETSSLFIKVGDYWKKDEESNVSNLIIKGNILHLKDKEVVGISTVHAGINKPDYQIEDNQTGVI